MAPQFKTCPCCKNSKPTADFDKYFNSKKGVEVIQTYCKQCRRERNNSKSKDYYVANRENRQEYARSYRADNSNKEKINIGMRKCKQAQRENLQDCYVVKNLSLKHGLPAAEIRSIEGFIQLERNTILLKRKIKELCQNSLMM